MGRNIILMMMFILWSNCWAEKKALIFGVSGQDGFYLTELLLEKGYEVHGVLRYNSAQSASSKKALFCDELGNENKNFFLHYGDLADTFSIVSLILNVNPDEIYNLGSQSQVRVSFDIPEQTAEINAIGPLRILEAIRILKLEKKTKFYQASTSELYGLALEVPQTETTPFYPRSPYGIAKNYAYWITRNFREAYGIFACNGILFNHESPRRGDIFLTRKVTKAAARIKLGLQDTLYIGNLDARKDWGFAKDYVEAMWKMLQLDEPDDYIIATGKTHSVKEFIEEAFGVLDISIEWQGSKDNEVGVNKATGKIIVKVDPSYYRPLEVGILVGNPSKAKEKLNWEAKTSFKELVRCMVEHDFNLEKKDPGSTCLSK